MAEVGMSDFPAYVYKNTLVAVFSAAHKLGLNPKALAGQAKREVSVYLQLQSISSQRQARQVIDESLNVARLIHEQGRDMK